LDIKLQP